MPRAFCLLSWGIRPYTLYRKHYRVAFHYIRYRSLTISLQRNAIADPPWQNPHSQDIDIKRGKEVKFGCETSLFVVAPAHSEAEWLPHGYYLLAINREELRRHGAAFTNP